MNQLAEAFEIADLITLDPRQYVAAVYQPLRERIASAKADAALVDYDAATTAGMAVAVKRRALVRGVRTAIEAARKERKAPVLEIGRLLDARAKELTAEIEPLEAAHDERIKAIEAIKEVERQARADAERQRVDAIQQRIAGIGRTIDNLAGRSSAETDAAWHETDAIAITSDDYAEFLGSAQVAKAEALDRIARLYETAVARENAEARLAAERAELDRRRLEQDERDRVAAAERAAAEIEARAERAADAERMRVERAQLAAEKAEVDRQRKEIADAQAAEQRQREQDERDAETQRRHLQAIEDRRQAEIKAARRPSDEAILNSVRDLRQDATHEEAIEWIASFDVVSARARKHKPF